MTKAQRAWIAVDAGNSCFGTTILVAVFPIYMNAILQGIDLSFVGFQLSALSLWGYTISVSVFITLLISLLLGSWADENRKRKELMLAFNFLGAASSICLGFTQTWWLLLVLFVFANIGFAGGNVFYNSLLASVANKDELDSMSLKGFAWGYISGGVMLAVNLAIIMNWEALGLSSQGQASRISFILVGITWALAMLPSLYHIKERAVSLKAERLSRVAILWRTIKTLPATPALLIFIIAYAFFNDAIQTVITMSSVFAKDEMRLADSNIIQTYLVIQILSWPFTLGMIKLAKRFGTRNVLSLSLIFWTCILGYGFFMQTATDFMILGVGVSVVMGVSQALPRSIYARLIPRNKQAEYFSLYAFSGKVSAIVGPAFFGIMMDATGNARIAIGSLAIFFIVGLFLLQFVDVPRADSELCREQDSAA